jgi:hypothetical protein
MANKTAGTTATATIEPKGRRTKVPREHLITLTLNLSAKNADKGVTMETLRKALAVLPTDQDNRAKLSENSVHSKNTHTVVSVEGTLMSAGRPEEQTMEQMRALLSADGFYLTIREMRECSQAGCLTDTMVDWNRPALVPSRWYSNQICDKHNYKTCTSCGSIFSMTSVNSPGQAPSVHCEVCGTVLVEWGSSKVWSAERVRK